MHPSRFLLVSVVFIVSLFAVPAHGTGALAQSSNYTVTHLVSHGKTVLGGHSANQTADPQTLSNEIQPSPAGEVAIQHVGTDVARVSADHVPAPVPNALAASNPGFSGFDGITHRDQRLAGTGAYSNAQPSFEPPDQGLCVGNGYVLETVNSAIEVFGTDGTPASGTLVPIAQFLGIAPALVRSTPIVYGPSTSDSKCYFDPATNRWFFTALEIDRNSATGAFSGPSSVMIAVSLSGDPTASWNVYSLDTTDDGTNGTPSHPNCPCFGDQPLIGADANGFYISTNEDFNVPPYFGNGAQIYAMSKWELAAGTMPTVVHLNVGVMPHPDAGGFWWKVQPASTAPGAANAPNTEYFISAVATFANLDNRLAEFALTSTNTLSRTNPQLTLTDSVMPSETFVNPPDAQQLDGPRPLAQIYIPQFFGIKTPPYEKLEFLGGIIDYPQSAVYSGGLLWAAGNTSVQTPNGPTRSGAAYYVINPATQTIVAQGYVSVNNAYLLNPAIGVNASGQAAMTFTLVGPTIYPSAAYTTLDLTHGAGDVHVMATGSGPEDGASGYTAFGGNGEAHWGDYSAAVADVSGNIWLATEYIPNAPRTIAANWGTFVGKVTP